MPEFEISFDPARIDVAWVARLLSTAYWAEGRTYALNVRAFAHSICVAAYAGGRQIGFGRIISDRAVFAYIADVIVDPALQGNGVGKALIRAMLDYPELAEVKGWTLRTGDAHAFYEQFGFRTLTDGRTMRLDR